MTDLATKIKIMQAALDGEEIQYQGYNGGWHDDAPHWNWREHDYRIKPEPRDFYVVLSNTDKFIGFDSDRSNASNILRNSKKSGYIMTVREVTDEN